jgi:hypothetical protein
MPTPKAPLAGTVNLALSATFFARKQKDLTFVASFTPQLSGGTTSLPLSAYFLYNKSLNLKSTFKQTSVFPISSYFNNTYHIANFSNNATFAQTSSFSTSANFVTLYTTSLPISSTFVQFVSAGFPNTIPTLPMNAKFLGTNTFPLTSLWMEATFYQNAFNNIFMNAFLGSINKNFQIASTFYQYGIKYFNASIGIQNYLVPQSVIYSNNTDFNSTIYIKGYVNADLPISANFGGKGPNDFNAAIQIINPYHGVANVQVVASLSDSYSLEHDMEKVPSDSFVYSDTSGYFYIDNLIPGTYTVTPIYDNLTFVPSSITVTIINQNISLNFNATGSFAESTLIAQPLYPVEVTTTNTSVVGNYSIDGYITPSITDIGQSILIIASNETDAANFRSGL